MSLIKKGKVKEVHSTEDPEVLEFLFTDNISVFDKVIPTSIPHKGETLNRTSEFWFKASEELGLRSHFIQRTGPNRMRVKKVNVIRDYDKITHDTANYLIPLEVIARYYAAGSFLDRIKKGKIDPKELGIEGEVYYGMPLPEPFVEFTTKLEKHDRPLTEKEAQDMAGLTDEELHRLKKAVLDIDAFIEKGAGSRGLIHVDGKKEFAFDKDRELMVIDTFATADEDRFWDREKLERGEFVELSKEFVRQHYRSTGYHERLMNARDANQAEPDIPPLPENVTSQVSELYINLFERLTGLDF